MSNDKMGIGDDVVVVLTKPVEKNETRANVHVVHRRGETVLADYWGENLVTDVGDGHIAKRIIEGDTEPIVTGMKLGTGATAAGKNTAGHEMGIYESGSQEALDAAPTDATKGAGNGWRATFICTWDAGDVVEAALAEVCLTNQTALADDTCAAADCIARFVFGSTIDKQAGDSLEVTWQIDVLGA
jgi:hypothetical protein